jgi:thiamine pyrophosphokinase
MPSLLRIEDRDRGAWTLLDDAPGAAVAAEAPRLLVVLAGAGFDLLRLRDEAERATAVVAADAGAILCRAAGIEPAAVVGDFDSISAEVLAGFAPEQLHPAPDPESNDLEKALAWVADRFGADAEVVLAAGGGVDGGRMDHALANLGPIVRQPHARISMVDGEGRLFALRQGHVTVRGLAGRRLSILPWSLHGVTVSETGVRYPLDRALLHLGGRGVSNEIAADEATVTVHDGVALVWVER